MELENLLKKIELYRCILGTCVELIFVEEGIAAGFPSPAQDYTRPPLDLNEKLIPHPAASLLGRITGSLSREGLNEGDFIIVDTSLKIRDKDWVLCIYNGELNVKQIRRTKNASWVQGEKNRELIDVEFRVLGVVTHSLHLKRSFDELQLHSPYINSFQCVGTSDFLNMDNYPVLDLNKFLIKNPTSTFFSKVAGDSLKEANVRKGDLVIIDKSLSLRHNDIAVCYVNGEFTLKFVQKHEDEIWLMPANKDFTPIKVTNDDFRIWGVVTTIINVWRGYR